MKKNTIEHKFSEYKKVILANIDTIKHLITQSNNLAELMDGIDEPTRKENIDTIRKQINKSIDDLIDNTEKLFAEYKKLADLYADKES